MKNFSYSVDKEMLQENSIHSLVSWGGFLETLQTCEDCEKEEGAFVKNLKMKITSLENSKSIKEIRENISHISEMERNYLNSPLLDEIFDTIQKECLSRCYTYDKPLALKFYLKFFLQEGGENFINNTLVLAASHGSKDVVNFLLENGADIKYKNSLVLFTACISGQTEIVKILIKINVNLKVLNEALPYAINRNCVELVKLMIENGVTIQDASLPLACEKGFYDMVKLLIENGADISDSCIFYYTAKYGHLEVSKLLMEHGKYHNRVLTQALTITAKYGYVKVTQFLLEQGADVHTNFEWPLETASSRGHIETVKLLLDYGAHVQSRCLYSAVEHGYKDIVKLLLEHGAVLEVHMLKKAIENKHTEIADLLLEYGAIPSFYDKTRLFMQKLFR